MRTAYYFLISCTLYFLKGLHSARIYIILIQHQVTMVFEELSIHHTKTQPPESIQWPVNGQLIVTAILIYQNLEILHYTLGTSISVTVYY